MRKRLYCTITLCFAVIAVKAQLMSDSTKAVQLSNVDVLSDIAKYRKDSISMAETYKKTYEDATRKPKKSFIAIPSPIGLSAGIQYEGLITAFARKISGKQKTDKRFVADFKRTQAEKYISLKYNPEVVKNVVAIMDDSIAAFIRAYPMEEGYARAASPLEIKMWIRSNFKDWITRLHVPHTDTLSGY